MSSCLGLYIEDNLIKYAKVSKDRENIKVDAFGIKFYEKIDKAISEIISETYSQKVPISINCAGETYNYFNMFSLLSKNDLQKAIKTEFEAYCTDKSYNPNAFETRYALVDDKKKSEKIKVIHISNNKIDLNKRIQMINGYHLTTVSPISMAIPNLVENIENKNYLIVNIENETTITTVIEDKISNVDIIESGMDEVLSKINSKENSYSKAYEVLKNTTIYTAEGKDLLDSELTYLEDIMPTLYQIVGNVMKIMNSSTEKIDKIYITGTGALINNVDLYFQEYLTGVNCKILRPYFIQKSTEISIKDYIEVNSAISIAMMGLNEGIAGMNFKKQKLGDKIPSWMKVEIDTGKTKKEQKNIGGWFTWDFNQNLDKTDRGLLRIVGSLLILIIIYGVGTNYLNRVLESKKKEIDDTINGTRNELIKIGADKKAIQAKANEYDAMIKMIEDAQEKITDRNKTRNSIPNLLNQIMSIVPKKVQITSIENTQGNHIVINAQSDKYEQLGYLKAKIKADVILTNVISTSGQKESSAVTVKIEGDLP